MPLFRVDLPSLGEEVGNVHFASTFESNIISSLSFGQPLQIAYEYSGAIVQIESLNYNTTVSFIGNTFQDLKIVGRDSQEASLIFINGA